MVVQTVAMPPGLFFLLHPSGRFLRVRWPCAESQKSIVDDFVCGRVDEAFGTAGCNLCTDWTTRLAAEAASGANYVEASGWTDARPSTDAIVCMPHPLYVPTLLAFPHMNIPGTLVL